VQEQTLTRIEIINSFSKHLTISQNQSSFLMENILAQIFQALGQDNILKISSFGTFVVHEKKERIGRNPKTGKEAIISARKSISFRGSELLKDKINRKKAWA
jgi:integration host factor subunit alpha